MSEPHQGRLAGATVAAGPEARATLGRWLGVVALERQGYSVDAAAWVSDHVEVEVATGEALPALLVIERADPSRPALVSCGRLAVRYLGQRLPRLLESVLRRVAPKTLARLDLEALARLVAGDPGSGQRGAPLPQRPESEQRRYDEGALLSTWGAPSVWRQFRALAEISRAQLDSLDYFNESIFVQHCDAECVFLAPQTGVPMIPLALYPWDDRLRRIDWRRAGRRREPEPGAGRLVTTDLDERDVILGRGPARLEAALDHLRRRGTGDATMIFCASTCVPVVAGEDFAAVLERYEGRFDAPLLHLTTSPHSMHALLRPILVDHRLAAEARAQEPDARAINLIGFAEDPTLDELAALLAEAGIRVNATALPAVGPRTVEALPRAALSVVSPIEAWRGHVDQLLHGSRTPALVHPAPFGEARTAAWLGAILGALGVDADAAALVERAWRPMAAEWSALRRRAAGRRVGLVVDGDAPDLTLDPAQTWGFPLPALLAEMGFEPVLLVAGSSEPRALPRGVERHLFETPEELRELLTGQRLSAAFSEQMFDRRLTEAGLSAFSLQHFEPGLAGAVRTLRRLVEVCELPFFHRYGRHLAAAAARSGVPPTWGGT